MLTKKAKSSDLLASKMKLLKTSSR